VPDPFLRPLYAIVDADVAVAAGWTPRDLCAAYLAGGARLLQLRAKALPAGAFLTLAQQCVADAARVGARVVVNDRADIAAIAGAAGVHVGQDDIGPRDVRRVLGDEAVVGLSTHTASQISWAVREPISYVAIGPVFGTATKDTGYQPVGLDAVRQAAEAARGPGLPVVAIGGITLATARAVIDAGAHSVAVITDLLVGPPDVRVREYLSALS
jgi:thiamine-phosphate pyrophosphorylase